MVRNVEVEILDKAEINCQSCLAHPSRFCRGSHLRSVTLISRVLSACSIRLGPVNCATQEWAGYAAITDMYFKLATDLLQVQRMFCVLRVAGFKQQMLSSIIQDVSAE